MASGSGRPPSIRLRFKRTDLELTPDGCDVSLEAALSEPLHGVFQSYGIWEYQRLHAMEGSTEQKTDQQSAEGAAEGATVQVFGAGGDQEAISEGRCGPGGGPCTGEEPSDRDTASATTTGRDKERDAGKRIWPVTASDSGRKAGAERAEVGQACAEIEDATRDWESLNFFPVYNLVYANPNKTPRAYRLREGHLLKVTSKKRKEETGVAGAAGTAAAARASGASGSAEAAGSSGAEETEGVSGVAGAAAEAGAAGLLGAAGAEGIGGPLSALGSGAAGRQQGQEAALASRVGGEAAQPGPVQAAAQTSGAPVLGQPTLGTGDESSLCTEVEARCRVTDTISGELPTVADGTLMVEPQAEGTATWEGKGEEEESTQTQRGSSTQSAVVEAMAGLLAMVELMERAVAHESQAQALVLQGRALDAGLECTRGCTALEGAPQWAELPERIKLLLQKLKFRLGWLRNEIYLNLGARAETSRQEKLFEECLMRLLRDCLNLMRLDPTYSRLYTRAAATLDKLGNTAAAIELLSRAEEDLYLRLERGSSEMADVFAGGDAWAGEARRAARRAALQEAFQELEAWEAKAGGDEEWLLRLKSDPVASMALGNP